MIVDTMFGPTGPMKDFLAHVDVAAQAYQARGLWFADHFAGNNAPKDVANEVLGAPPEMNLDSWHDPFITIAAHAARSDAEFDYGISVTDFIRRKPVDIARCATGLSQIIGKPLMLGVGAGERENLVPVDYPFPEKPVGYFEESVAGLRRLLDDPVYLSDSGYEIQLDYSLSPAEIWIGGQRPRMLRITAQYGDGWLPAWYMSAEQYAEKAQLIAEKAEGFARPCPTLAMYFNVTIGRSRAELIAGLDQVPVKKLHALLAPGETWQKYDMDHPFGNESKGMYDVMLRDRNAAELLELAPTIPNELMGEYFYMGNADELFAQMSAFAEAGMERCILFYNPTIVPTAEPEELDFREAEFQRLIAKLTAL